jgi:hypothetical protein
MSQGANMIGKRKDGAGGWPLLSRSALILVAASVTACADQGPVTDCIVADSRGNAWQGSDVTPLSAQETARIACGRESPDPTSCTVKSCTGRW